MNSDPIKLLEEYSKEIDLDTSIDVTNILEKQFASPNVKNKWLVRLYRARKDLADLIDQKDSFIHNNLTSNNPMQLSKATIATKCGSDPTYKQIQKKIKDQELLVEYLDSSVNKIFSQMGFDFKNLVELLKMEQL